MAWNIAEAKQKLSEVVRLTAEEPQVIYNRGRPVAVVIDPKTLEALETCRRQARTPTLAEELTDLRRIVAEEDYELEIPPRIDRPNAFLQMLDEEEGLSAKAGDAAP